MNDDQAPPITITKAPIQFLNSANDDEIGTAEQLDSFFTVEKVFLILTNSGKPIYSS